MSESTEELEKRVAALEAEVAFFSQALEYIQTAILASGVDRDLTVDLFRKLGLGSVEGRPIAEWWGEESKKHRETVLLHIEDQHAGTAAYLQSVVDRSTGSGPPET